MKRIVSAILSGLVAASAARADTPLAISTVPAVEACLYNNIVILFNQPAITGNFTLNGVSGSGVVQSGVSGFSPNPPYSTLSAYNYSIDLSGMAPAANHCVKLVIHFGTPDGCNGPAVAASNPGQIQSATLSPYGDITFVFAGGCLQPGQPSIGFTMLSDTGWKTNFVTVIDDYFDPANGHTNETRINVPAIVPDVAPNFPPWWAYAPPPFPFPSIFFQGILYCNAVPIMGNQLGAVLPYDFKLQLYDAPSNGMAVSQIFTQTVQVANGLFNMPLPFDPVSVAGGTPHWLNIGVRPAGSNVNFTALGSALPLTPTAQALYAYTAGTVADLTPGQAVTSLNGLTDAVTLQAGNGILLGTNGNTLTITAQPGVVSDKNLKTDFAQLNPETMLARLAALPLQGWRYTNEPPGVRHVGPMAQDFKSAFGLGQDDRFIAFVDEEGVALAAIQGLNQKVEAENAALRAENVDLRARLERIEQAVSLISTGYRPPPGTPSKVMTEKE